MDTYKSRIFISYKRVDMKRVFEIKDYIEKNVGENCWIDLDGIESDAQFVNVIIKAINNAEVFLFMYSQSHAEIVDFSYDWSVREINFAEKKAKRIVFVNIDNTPLTDWFEIMFGLKQQVDATSDVAMSKLSKDLKKWLSQNPYNIIDNNNQSYHSNKIKAETTRKQVSDKQETISISRQEELYEYGKLYFSSLKDSKKAIDYLIQAANAGHVESQNFLGLIYTKEKDYVNAFKWFLEAAENNHPYAQYNLGKIYSNGHGGEVNYREAIRWFMEAAKNGNIEANNMIGVFYEEGRGVKKNFNTAYEYYLIAARLGNVSAQYNIGCLILQNKVTSYNLKKSDAIYWLELAAKQGDCDAQSKLRILQPS